MQTENHIFVCEADLQILMLSVSQSVSQSVRGHVEMNDGNDGMTQMTGWGDGKMTG